MSNAAARQAGRSIEATVAQELSYIIFDVGVGWLGVLGSARGLLSITLPQSSAQEARHQLGDKLSQAKLSPAIFEGLMGRLRAYFGGAEATFPDELDLSLATPFQREVWEITRLIPYGETRSYGWVAEQIGEHGAARAVGQALGRNPLPIIIPCHRVLTGQGKLGGFSGGLEMKRHLLSWEALTKSQGITRRFCCQHV